MLEATLNNDLQTTYQGRPREEHGAHCWVGVLYRGALYRGALYRGELVQEEPVVVDLVVVDLVVVDLVVVDLVVGKHVQGQRVEVYRVVLFWLHWQQHWQQVVREVLGQEEPVVGGFVGGGLAQVERVGGEHALVKKKEE